MRKILITGILISLNLCLSLNASALTDAQISTKIDSIQANVPAWTPNAPSGMDQKGFVWEMLANLFDGNNKIKGFFIQAFQSIWNTQANTLPRWNGQSFTAGTIRDNGTNIWIGTGILNNRRVNIAGDVNFTGDLYKNGALFTPTLPTDIVRTTGDQMIGGIKTFTSNARTENASPTNYYLDTNHRSAMIHVNNNNFYVLRGAGTGSTTLASYNGRWPLQISLENNNAIFGWAWDFLGNITTQSGTFIWNGSTLTNLNASNLTSGTISSSRLPNDVVRTSGNQTIGGTKTFSSAITGSITGNAGTATKLATARKINGVAFDGTKDITITAAGDNLPNDVVRTSGNQTIGGTKTFSSTISGSITGNAGTATKLATARKINGVAFDGTKDITITAAGDDLGDHEATKNLKMNGKDIDMSWGTLNMVGWSIANLATPTAASHAATKGYVDNYKLKCTTRTTLKQNVRWGVDAKILCETWETVTWGYCATDEWNQVLQTHKKDNGWYCYMNSWSASKLSVSAICCELN